MSGEHDLAWSEGQEMWSKMGSPRRFVRKNVANALGATHGEDAVPLLQDLLVGMQDEDREVRTLAQLLHPMSPKITNNLGHFAPPLRQKSSADFRYSFIERRRLRDDDIGLKRSQQQKAIS